MEPTLTLMVPTTLARGLLMLSLRPRLMLMLLSSTADTDMLPLPTMVHMVDMLMVLLPTTVDMPMVATLLMELTLTSDKKNLAILHKNNHNRIQQHKARQTNDCHQGPPHTSVIFQCNFFKGCRETVRMFTCSNKD